LRCPTDVEMRARVEAAFSDLDPTGGVAAECWRDYSRKLDRWRRSAPDVETLEARWPDFDAALGAILAPAPRLVAALDAAGAAVRLSDLAINHDRLRWALVSCHLMRDRFTVADLAFFMGMFEAEDVDELLADAARIGAGA
jgi:glycerol-1-phosphate dehydrogenase [NAD(P)+]